MAKVNLADLQNLENPVSAVGTINANTQKISQAMDNTLSRDGTGPNAMLDELDMNSNRIINLPKATSDLEPVRKREFDQAVFGNLGLSPDDEGLLIFTGTDAEVRTLTAGPGLDILNPTGKTGNPSIVFDNATVTALAKAETSLQPSDLAALDLTFETVALAAAYKPIIAPNSIRVKGYYAAADGGGALYKKVASEPTHSGKFSITLSDLITIVWYEIAEKEIDPEQLPTTAVTEDTDAFIRALAFANRIVLDPRKTYKIYSMLTITRPVVIDLNGATVQAAAGFTDDNLFKITSSNVQIFNGTLDGTNLPDRTSDFIGADFKSFTVFCLGTSGVPLTGLKFERVNILSGDTACIAAKYCPGISFGSITLNGANTSAVYSTEALAHIQYCDNAQVARIAMWGIKHKGWAFYSSNGWVAQNITAQTTAAGESAIFAGSGCAYWIYSDVSVFGGFGAKADGCYFGVFRNINVNGNGVATGGIILQGCVEVTVQGGSIRGFTQTGVSVSSHPLNLTASQDCRVLDMDIYGNGTALDNSCGIYLSADTTYGNYGTTLRGNFIRTVDKGILITSLGTGLVDNIRVENNRFLDCKTFALYGPSLSLLFCNNSVEIGLGQSACVQTWSQGTGSTLKVSGNQASNISNTTPFLYVLGNSGASMQASYTCVEFNSNQGWGGARAIVLDLRTNSDRINTFVSVGNTWRGGNDASTYYLNNANTVDKVQVNISQNLLLANDNTKKTINFVQTAASGAWNGIVVWNMAVVTNSPNNV